MSFLSDVTSCVAAAVERFSHRMLRGQKGCSNSDRILWSCVFVRIRVCICHVFQWKSYMINGKRINSNVWTDLGCDRLPAFAAIKGRTAVQIFSVSFSTGQPFQLLPVCHYWGVVFCGCIVYLTNFSCNDFNVLPNLNIHCRNMQTTVFSGNTNRFRRLDLLVCDFANCWRSEVSKYIYLSTTYMYYCTFTSLHYICLTGAVNRYFTDSCK